MRHAASGCTTRFRECSRIGRDRHSHVASGLLIVCRATTRASEKAARPALCVTLAMRLRVIHCDSRPFAASPWARQIARSSSHRVTVMSMRVGLLAVAALILAACQEASPPLAPTDQPSSPACATGPAQTIPGRYIVVFRRSVKDADRDAMRLVGVHRGKLKHVYRSALRGMALDLPDEAVAALRADPSVAYVEPDQVAHIVTDQAGATWGLDRVDQHALPLTTTYTYFVDGAGVHVYIIDTGIHLGHTEFIGRLAPALS